MRLCTMLEPQEGLRYDQILAVARRTEELGFDGLYRSDHYSSVEGREGIASTDAWATLAGLARDTERIRLGTVVSPVTFRSAGSLAKVVATVAEMAAGGAPAGDRPAGRVELGMGTGWLESEHRQHGFAFGDLATRFRRLEEHLQIVLGLWDPDRPVFSFDGEFERLVDARFAPKPDPRPRILVGGKGLRTTPRLAATYADELNSPMRSPAQCRQLRDALDRACEGVGRDPAAMPFSLMTGLLVGATADEFRARARRLQELREDGRPLHEFVRGLEDAWVAGTPEQAAQRLGELADARVERVLLQDLLPDDEEMLDVVADEIVPKL